MGTYNGVLRLLVPGTSILNLFSVFFFILENIYTFYLLSLMAERVQVK